MKPSIFNIHVDSYFEGVHLVFNTRRGYLVALGSDEYHHALEMMSGLKDASGELWDTLVVGGFVVEPDENERQAVKDDYRRSVQNICDSDGRAPLALTICPTVGCNFRCTYCFESHPNRWLSRDDIANLERFVAARLAPGTTSLSVT